MRTGTVACTTLWLFVSRTTESASKSALDGLLRILGAVASTEARRQSQRTLGLAPLHRAAHTVSVAPAVAPGSELIVLDELHVAYLRAAPPLCHLRGKEGIAGVLFFFCCSVLALSTKICDFCGCLSSSSLFDRFGCRARGTLPMCCPEDTETGPRPGTGRTTPSPAQLLMLRRYYQRVQCTRASSSRQIAPCHCVREYRARGPAGGVGGRALQI